MLAPFLESKLHLVKIDLVMLRKLESALSVSIFQSHSLPLGRHRVQDLLFILLHLLSLISFCGCLRMPRIIEIDPCLWAQLGALLVPPHDIGIWFDHCLVQLLEHLLH